MLLNMAKKMTSRVLSRQTTDSIGAKFMVTSTAIACLSKSIFWDSVAVL